MKRLMSFLAACLILPCGMASVDSREVYNSTKYGKCYHYSFECAGKHPIKITLDEALQRKLKPCKRCVD